MRDGSVRWVFDTSRQIDTSSDPLSELRFALFNGGYFFGGGGVFPISPGEKGKNVFAYTF